jgi:Tol biopolymer transport system component
VMAMPDVSGVRSQESGVMGQDLEELRRVLDRELDRLADKYRVAVVLCDLEGKSRKEAAKQLGVAEGTLSGRLTTARRLLARRLARHGVTLSGGALAAILSDSAASACVSKSLLASTAQAATALAAGQASSLISTKAVALTEGVLKNMLLSKLKIGAAVALLVALVSFEALGLMSSSQKAEAQAAGALPRVAGAAPATAARHTQAPKKSARIFVTAGSREDDKLVNQLIAIDPETGKWKKIGDGGHQPRISPDGETVLFGTKDTIFNCDTGGSNNPGLISDKGHAAVWSPDGKQIIVTGSKQEKGVWHADNWLMNADGSNPSRLPIHDEDHVHDWSPDGKWLLTVSDRDRIRIDRKTYINYGYQIYLMQPDGKKERRLTKDGVNLRPRFSPDGKKILYNYLRPDRVEGGWWIMDADGGNPREIYRREGMTASDWACWSPDGKHVALVLFEWSVDEKGRRIFEPSEIANYRIEIMDADGKNRRQVSLENLKPVFLGDVDWR